MSDSYTDHLLLIPYTAHYYIKKGSLRENLFTLQQLCHAISPHQEIGEYLSFDEVEMIPQARYAVNLVAQLLHQSPHQVTTWHFYCNGFHYKATSKYEEACAMAVVVVGEI